MKSPIRIVIVSFLDDNFGDVLIRVSFQKLLEVALANHGVNAAEYVITPMSLKHVDEALLSESDVVFFAGGGLFGVSYLGFYEHMDRITAIADKRGVPVVFSSMGLNNMGAADGNYDAIADIVNRRSVKAIAVRENLDLFQRVSELDVKLVSDPAVWTKYVYGMTDTVPDGTLGINVVRGGLFASNQRPWKLNDELNYLSDLLTLTKEAGLEPRFYTNGSLDDNKTLRVFAAQQDLPDEQWTLPQTTRDVVEAIAPRSAIASIRMHSSIISYSFGIPSTALEWNDKLPHFYRAIGHPERLLPVGEWDATKVIDLLKVAGDAPEKSPGYVSYLMSSYTHIFDSLGAHVLDGGNGAERFGFDAVAKQLVDRAPSVDDNEADLRHKMDKAERFYTSKERQLDESKAALRTHVKDAEKLSAQVKKLTSENLHLRDEVKSQQQSIALQRQQLEEKQREIDLRFTTRLARYVRRIKIRIFQR